MEIKINGLNNLDKYFDNLQKNLEEASKPENVSFAKLFNSSFMAKYTNFDSLEKLLESGGIVINSKEDFEAIPETQLDELVSKTTQFDTWKDMLKKASADYFASKLKF